MLWSDLEHQLINIKELERLRRLSRDMMKKLEPIDELTAEIIEMRTERLRRCQYTLDAQKLTFCRRGN